MERQCLDSRPVVEVVAVVTVVTVVTVVERCGSEVLMT